MLRNITLELSLKPFKEKADSHTRKVCSAIFEQWAPLIKNAEMVSIMLWAADGSEILEYKGDLSQTFEWSYWLGCPNKREPSKSKSCLNVSTDKYIKNPPVFDYLWLRNMIAIFKETGHEMTGKQIRVGATFDPGPEFAVSKFKYTKHPEICNGESHGKKSFVTCNTRLHADLECYAGFPDGIEEGTKFGVFFGRQCNHFLKDMNYDFLWLSNGFGFGLEALGFKGHLFDGIKFMPEKAEEISTEVLSFWKYFKRECPNFPIETRGSNMSAGIEIATDACPIKEIYEKYKPAPPINSPWAAINGDVGVEVLGWMSHIAELPEENFTFRYYIHDPWFMNTPWLERYHREPYDIYMPLSVSRIKENGDVQTADSINFLSIDDSYGNMPDQVPNEVIPHILQAFKQSPDAPGPLVLVYPFDEYNECLKTSPEKISGIFADEWFIKGAFNHGLPLNTVISTGNLRNNLSKNPDFLNGSILVIPASILTGINFKIVHNFILNGGNILIYGSLSNASRKLLQLLGIKIDAGLTGELKINFNFNIESSGIYPENIYHSNLLCDGPLTETADNNNTSILASVSDKEGNERLLAASTKSGKGTIVWVRTENSCPETDIGRNLWHFPRDQYFHAEHLVRLSLKEFGMEINFKRDNVLKLTPSMTISRKKNIFYFSGFTPNTNMEESFKLPYGAPVFTGSDTKIVDGKTYYTLPRSWQYECQLFVKQEKDTELISKIHFAGHPSIKKRVFINGLKNAELIFFPEKGFEDKTSIDGFTYHDSPAKKLKPEKISSSSGIYLKIKNVTGKVLFSW